jgi:competence protein ComFB
MQIHNAMEDIVIKHLNEIVSERDDLCRCEQCLKDMACYALNKIRPMYMVSSRGVIHAELKKQVDIQDDIDILAIINEAIQVVSRTKRHDVNDDCRDESNLPFDNDIESSTAIKGAYFNFPQIVGRVFNGTNLEPLSGVHVSLSTGTTGEQVAMFNNQWHNPFTIIDPMNGTFAFWPSPKSCERSGIQRDFTFTISFKLDGFETLMRTFKITILSFTEIRNYIENAHTYHLEDVFLTEEGVIEE